MVLTETYILMRLLTGQIRENTKISNLDENTKNPLSTVKKGIGKSAILAHLNTKATISFTTESSSSEIDGVWQLWVDETRNSRCSSRDGSRTLSRVTALSTGNSKPHFVLRSIPGTPWKTEDLSCLSTTSLLPSPKSRLFKPYSLRGNRILDYITRFTSDIYIYISDENGEVTDTQSRTIFLDGFREFGPPKFARLRK